MSWSPLPENQSHQQMQTETSGDETLEDKRHTRNSMSMIKRQERQQKVIRNKPLTIWNSNILQFLEKLLSSVRVFSQTESVGEQSSDVNVFDILNDGPQAWQTFTDDRILWQKQKQTLWVSFLFEFIMCFLKMNLLWPEFPVQAMMQ